MPTSRKSVLAALAMNDNGKNVIESLSHVAAVKITKIPQSKLTLITSKFLSGADSTSNMSDASSTCSSIDNSSMDSLNSVAEEASARSGRSDGRNEDGPRTRSSSGRRSLGMNKIALVVVHARTCGWLCTIFHLCLCRVFSQMRG